MLRLETVDNAMIEKDDKERKVESFNLEEKIANLPPSREILEFYRQQIRDLENDNAQTFKKLSEYRTLCDDYHIVLKKINNYENEVSKLQRALSDLQDYLFREKELNASLKKELCALKSEKTLANSVKFHRCCKQKENNFGTSNTSERSNKPDQAKYEEIQYLRRQLIDYSSASEDRVENILEENRKRYGKMEEKRKEDAEKIHALTNKLKRAQDMLYDNTKQLLETQAAFKEERLKFMEEKEILVKEAKFSRREAANISKQTMIAVDQKVRDSGRANNHLKHQVKKLEAEISNCQETSIDTKRQLEEQLRQTTECLALLAKRYKNLGVRTKLEVEGYKRDINVLKAKLEDAEADKVAMAQLKDFDFDIDDDNYDDLCHFQDEGKVAERVKRKASKSGSSKKLDQAKKCRPIRSGKIYFRK